MKISHAKVTPEQQQKVAKYWSEKLPENQNKHGIKTPAYVLLHNVKKAKEVLYLSLEQAREQTRLK